VSKIPVPVLEGAFVDIKPELHIRQTQKLIMTPQLQQAIKMLQLSNLELNQRIEEELIENPALEKEDREEYSLEELNEEDILQKVEKLQDDKVDDDFDEVSIIADGDYPFMGSGEDKKREFIEGTVSREETLKEYLLQQIHLLEENEERLHLLEMLISYIDENGYLSVPLEKISEENEVSLEVLEDALRIVQNLDPPGVGARTIQECLTIQLRNKGHYPLAERVVRDCLQELKLKRYADIMRKCKVSKARLDEVLSLISHLEPYPGRQYYSEDIRYIVPDVIVEEREGEFEVIPNSPSIPRLRVNRYFEELMKKRGGDKRVKEFVTERVQRAKTFMHSIDQRESTLLRVMRAIVDHQNDFFQRGPLYLKPLTLKDISQEVDLHESTVSRITSSKYAQTPFGVYSLKDFFSNPIHTEGGGDYSSTSIKVIIKDLIENEGSKSQLSDQKIVDLLQKRGVKIARRTVAKYRKELNILPSNLRRPS
jgi:RNA polymerase sigma-54 factor